MRDETFVSDGLRLHYVVDGPESGPLVVLLHGFPEFWWGWRRQIPALATAGFRVAALDLRGTGESEAPREVERYDMQLLAGDTVALINHLGRERAHLVGHDWGAGIAWAVALGFPQRVERLAALQVPHPRAFLEGFRSVAQLRASWYAWFIQFEGTAEQVFGADRCRFLVDWAFGRGLFSDQEIERYRSMLDRPGRLTAWFAVYRANYRPDVTVFPPEVMPNATVPTLFIYGDADFAILPVAVERCGDYVDAPYQMARLKGASHWVQHERADEVNRLLVDFLRE